MKRSISILSICLFSLVALQARSQTRIKTNALYWAVLVPNVSVETYLGPHFTFNGDVVMSFWESIHGRPYMGGQVIAEGRYYIKEAFRGFYAGAYFGFDRYRVSKWDHPATDIHHGYGLAPGLTLGYQFSIGGRWNMDCYVGGGWHAGRYYMTDKNTGEVTVEKWNKSGEWIPYKAGVAFSYRLGKK